MFTYKQVREAFDGPARAVQARGGSYGAARLAGVRNFHSILGLGTAPDGRPFHEVDDRNLPVLGAGRISGSQFSLRHLAEAVGGHDWVEEYFHPSGGFNFGDRHLLEAAVDPTSQVNINAFNLAVAGLLNALMLERFNQPEFFGRNLITVKPTKMNGQKFIAVARMPTVSKAAKGRMPGEQHAEIGFTDAYENSPETVEQALKCKVTREAVFYDNTGEVQDEAGMVGHECAYQQEKDIADSVLGISSSYNRNGTSYATYQSTSPYVNQIAANGAQPGGTFDFNSIDKARQLFVGMTDPESGKEIKVIGNTILVMPARELLMRQQVFGPNVQISSQLTTANFPGVWTQGPNPLQGRTSPWAGSYDVVNVGPIWYNRLLAADGLGLTAANAQQYWYVGDFAKAVYWMENWPLTPWQASADQLALQDQGLVSVFGANLRGVSFVVEPRYAVRSTN